MKQLKLFDTKYVIVYLFLRDGEQQQRIAIDVWPTGYRNLGLFNDKEEAENWAAKYNFTSPDFKVMPYDPNMPKDNTFEWCNETT
jgi:hypothetical protein